MNILNYYAKILPSNLFKKKEEKQYSEKKRIEDAYKHIRNQHNNKVSNDSWIKDFEKPTYTRSAVVDYNVKNHTPLSSSFTTYNVVDEKDFTQYNYLGGTDLVTESYFPLTSGYTMIGNEFVPNPQQNKNPVIENFLGMDNPINRIPRKREVENMFTNEERLGQKQNLTVHSTEIKDRFISSDRRNDTLLTDPQRIPPGLGKSYDDNSQRGLHPLLRVLPKNVDQIRNLNHQKKTYQNEIVLGQQMSQGVSTIGAFNRKFEDNFEVDRPVVKSSSVNKKPMLDGEYRNDPTKRDVSNREYTGSAYATGKYSKHERLAIYTEEPKTNEYRTPDNFLISASTKAPMVADKDSVYIPLKSRAVHNKPDVLGPNRNTKTHTVNYFDLPKITVRDSQVSDVREGFISGAKKETRVYSPDDIHRNTTKETTVMSDLNIGKSVTPTTKARAVDYNDISKNTIRNTVNTTRDLGLSAAPTVQRPVAIDYSDVSRNTIRNTLNTTRDLGLSAAPTIQKPVAIDYSDVSRNTIRETTIQQDNMVGKVVTYNNKQIRTFDDNIRDTKKESTLQDTRQLTARSGSNIKENIVVSKDHVAKKTIRQTTADNSPEIHLRPDGSQQQKIIIDDSYIPRQTVKETNVITDLNRGNFVSRVGKEGVVTNPEDLPKNTQRQLQHVDYQGNPFYSEGKGYASNPQEMKTTYRQTTSVNTHFNEGGSMAQQTKPTVYEPQNISIIPDRNEIFEKESERFPTTVAGASTPQIHTTGAVKLRHFDVPNRTIMSNNTQNIVYKPDFSNNFTIKPNRDNYGYDRLDEDTSNLKDNLQNNEYSLHKILYN